MDEKKVKKKETKNQKRKRLKKEKRISELREELEKNNSIMEKNKNEYKKQWKRYGKICSKSKICLV